MRTATRTRTRTWVVGALILGALGFLVARGLGDATVFFKTADEAVAQRASLGTRRFRIEGTVVAGTVHQVGDDVRFVIENKGATVAVRHRGDPPELFRPGIPVVLEGRFMARPGRRGGDGAAEFQSDRIMVKHTEDYRAKHPDRVSGTSQ